ncbi:MAG: twin-arginine translocase subunit TatC [Muribaculaceae bacterium]|nr:twin-arginine translocase subunit TatC [Muribaculaceae bacterium]
MTDKENKTDFWGHLDILRTAIIKIVAVWIVFSIISFVLKDFIFNLVLAPNDDNFITYCLIDSFCRHFKLEQLLPVNVQLINVGLAQQFLIHVKTAMSVGCVLAAPYALYEIFSFLSPGLYSNERKYVSRFIFCGYAMFLLGILLSYFIIFPVTFQFLVSYQVSSEVINMISLDSYMATLLILCLCMGIVCELPVLSWLFAKIGLVRSSFMSQYRRHAIVIILIIAAIITPTSDIFTLLLVSVPIWILYELSIVIVRNTEKRRDKK